jgi:hypothetical protein
MGERASKAAALVVWPVPPLAMATVPVTLAAVPVAFPVTLPVKFPVNPVDVTDVNPVIVAGNERVTDPVAPEAVI